MSTFPAISRFMVSDQVVHALRTKIVVGELAEGTSLAEAQYAAEFGVSRMPVREALLQLARDGLVEFDKRGRGRVRSLSRRDFDEILTLRLALEGLAVQDAATQADAQDLAAMEQNLKAFNTAVEISDLARLDVEFHELLVRAAHHQRLHDCWLGLRWPYQALLTRIYRDFASLFPRNSKSSAKDHRAILKAVRNHDRDLARQLIEEHILQWRNWNPAEK